MGIHHPSIPRLRAKGALHPFAAGQLEHQAHRIRHFTRRGVPEEVLRLQAPRGVLREDPGEELLVVNFMA